MQGRVILALLVRLDHGDHGMGSDKASDVVHVSVRVVAGDAAVEPDHGPHAKIIGEQLLIGRTVHRRIALLRGGEQHFPVVSKCHSR